MVQLQSIAAMSRYYQRQETLPLDLPIIFGSQHSYSTRCSDHFANLNVMYTNLPTCHAQMHTNALDYSKSYP